MDAALILLIALATSTAIWLAGTAAAAAAMRVSMKAVTFGAGPVLATLPLRGGPMLEFRLAPVVSNVSFVTRAEATGRETLFADLSRLAKVALALSGCAACLMFAALILGPNAAARAAVTSWSDVFRAVMHARDVETQWGPIVAAARTLPTFELLGLAAAKVGGFNLLPLAGLSGWSAISALVSAPDGSLPPIIETIGKFTLFVLFGLLILWAVSGVEFLARAAGMIP